MPDPTTRQEAERVESRLTLSPNDLTSAKQLTSLVQESAKWRQQTLVFGGRTYWTSTAQQAVSKFFQQYRNYSAEQARKRYDINELLTSLKNVKKWRKDVNNNPTNTKIKTYRKWKKVREDQFRMQRIEELQKKLNKNRVKTTPLSQLIREHEERNSKIDSINNGVEILSKTLHSQISSHLLGQGFPQKFVNDFIKTRSQYIKSVSHHLFLTNHGTAPDHLIARAWKVFENDSNLGTKSLIGGIDENTKLAFIQEAAKQFPDAIASAQSLYDNSPSRLGVEDIMAKALEIENVPPEKAYKYAYDAVNALEARNLNGQLSSTSPENTQKYLAKQLSKMKVPYLVRKTFTDSEIITAIAHDYSLRHATIEMRSQIDGGLLLNETKPPVQPANYSPPLKDSLEREQHITETYDLLFAPQSEISNNHLQQIINALDDDVSRSLIHQAVEEFDPPQTIDPNERSQMDRLINDLKGKPSLSRLKQLLNSSAQDRPLKQLGLALKTFYSTKILPAISGIKNLFTEIFSSFRSPFLSKIKGFLSPAPNWLKGGLGKLMGKGLGLLKSGLGQLGKSLTSGALKALGAKLAALTAAAVASTGFWVVVGILLILVVAIVYFIASPLSTLNQALSEYVPVGAGGGGSGDGTPWNGELITFDLKDGVCWPTTGCMGGYMPEHHPSISDAGSAIDVGNIIGTPVISPFEGDVIKASHGFNDGYGNLVITTVNLPTQNGSRACDIYYAHLEVITLPPQTRRVSPGTLIGLMGNTGNSSGSHLHYEVRCGSVKGDIRSLFPPPDRNIQAGQCIINQCVDDKNQPFTPVIIQP
jgi:hypothetical protein